MFSLIVAGFDGSRNAETAVRQAAEMAVLCGAELVVLTVFRHHSLLEASFSMVRPKDPGSMDDAMREHAVSVAEHGKKVAQEAGAKSARAFVRSGNPARAIVAFAHERNAGLIVVGSRGMGSVESYLLGSVSHKISGLAACPVLVV